MNKFLQALFDYSPLGILKGAGDVGERRAFTDELKLEEARRKMQPVGQIYGLPTRAEETSAKEKLRQMFEQDTAQYGQDIVAGKAEILNGPDIGHPGVGGRPGVGVSVTDRDVETQTGIEKQVMRPFNSQLDKFRQDNPNLDPNLTFDENATRATITQKTRPPNVPFKQQDIQVTPEMASLAGGLLQPGQIRKGFEVDEAFKQTRAGMLDRFRQDRFDFDRAIKTLPPQGLIDDVANIQTSTMALDTIENLCRQAFAEGKLPVGRVEGYLTQGKQFLGLLTEEESTIRTEIMNNIAVTLRQLGGTALTKTERETFEEALPLLTNSPTEFFARIIVIRSSLQRKQQALEDTSGRFGRPVPGNAPPQASGNAMPLQPQQAQRQQQPAAPTTDQTFRDDMRGAVERSRLYPKKLGVIKQKLLQAYPERAGQINGTLK